MPKGEFFCYTDGSCKTSEGAPGGWGFVIHGPEGPPLEGYGSATHTLAKIMEYQAVAEALLVLPEGASAVVFSDNQSLVLNLTRQLSNWRASSFANVDPMIVESAKRIDRQISERKLQVKWQWVRSHHGNAGNERADALAAQGAREAKSQLGSAPSAPRRAPRR